MTHPFQPERPPAFYHGEHLYVFATVERLEDRVLHCRGYRIKSDSTGLAVNVLDSPEAFRHHVIALPTDRSYRDPDPERGTEVTLLLALEGREGALAGIAENIRKYLIVSLPETQPTMLVRWPPSTIAYPIHEQNPARTTATVDATSNDAGHPADEESAGAEAGAAGQEAIAKTSGLLAESQLPIEPSHALPPAYQAGALEPPAFRWYGETIVLVSVDGRDGDFVRCRARRLDKGVESPSPLTHDDFRARVLDLSPGRTYPDPQLGQAVILLVAPPGYEERLLEAGDRLGEHLIGFAPVGSNEPRLLIASDVPKLQTNLPPAPMTLDAVIPPTPESVVPVSGTVVREETPVIQPPITALFIPLSDQGAADPDVSPYPNAQAEPPAASAPTAAPAPPAGLALALGGQHYALRFADTTGSTAVVWQARLLPGVPAPDEFAVLQPSAETRARLIEDARGGRRYPDTGSGDLTALKLALPGGEGPLEREAVALYRLGRDVLRLYFPNLNSARKPEWSPDFPCLAMEWVDGQKLAGLPAFAERDGLEVCAQLAELLYVARLSAPDIVLTDGLKADGVFVARDAKGAPRVRIIDWNVYATEELSVREKTLLRFGEVMVGVFAPALEFHIDRRTDEASLEQLGAGGAGEAGPAQWDTLTHGTRNLIRRVLQREFDGDASAIVRGLRTAIRDQATCWAVARPLDVARGAVGATRLNWLDVAAARGEPVSEQEYKRLVWELVDEYGRAGQYAAALLELRTARRRYPKDDYFRWATLAHAVAGQSGDPRAYVRLKLGESLEHMAAGRYGMAAAGLAWAQEILESPGLRPTKGAREYLNALTGRAKLLARVTGGLKALQEDWQLEVAEDALAEAHDLASACARWEAGLLAGPDATCEGKLAELETAIADFREKIGQPQAAAVRPGALDGERRDRVRSLAFGQIIERARRLAAQEKAPDSWAAAVELYDRGEVEYPLHWRDEEHGAARREVWRKLADHRANDFMQQAKNNLDADPARAQACLTQVLWHRPGDPDATRLLAAMLVYQRAAAVLERGLAGGDLNQPGADLEWAARAAPELRGASRLSGLVNLQRRLRAAIQTLDGMQAGVEPRELLGALKEAQALREEAKTRQKAEPGDGRDGAAIERLDPVLVELEKAETGAREKLRSAVERLLAESSDVAEFDALLPGLSEDRFPELRREVERGCQYARALVDLKDGRFAQALNEWKKAAGTPDGPAPIRIRARDEITVELLARLQKVWDDAHARATAPDGHLLDVLREALQKLRPDSGSLDRLAEAVLGPSPLSDDELQAALLPLGESTDGTATAFAEVLSRARYTQIKKAVDGLEKLNSQIVGYWTGLHREVAPIPTVSKSASGILRDALDVVWGKLFGLLGISNRALPPELTALLVRDLMRDSQEHKHLAKAVAKALDPKGLKVLKKAGELRPGDPPAFDGDPSKRFAYALRGVYPNEESLRHEMEERPRDLERGAGIGNAKPGEGSRGYWGRGLALAGAGGMGIVILTLLLVLFRGWPVAVAGFTRPTATVTVTATPPPPRVDTPTRTAEPPTASPGPTETPTATLTPTATDTPVVTFGGAIECEGRDTPMYGRSCSITNTGSAVDRFGLLISQSTSSDLNNFQISVDVDGRKNVTPDGSGMIDLGSFPPNVPKNIVLYMSCPQGKACPMTTVHIALHVKDASQPAGPEAEFDIRNFFIPPSPSPQPPPPPPAAEGAP